MMVNTTKLDLTLDLFGTKMLAPIVAGPISRQNTVAVGRRGEPLPKSLTDAKAVLFRSRPERRLVSKPARRPPA